VQKGQRKIDEASLRYSKGCCCEGRKNKETHRSFLVLYTYIIGIHGSANGGGGTRWLKGRRSPLTRERLI